MAGCLALRTKYVHIRRSCFENSRTIKRCNSKWKAIVQDIRDEKALELLWQNYTEINTYAAGLQFQEVVNTVEEIGTLLSLNSANDISL